MYLSGADNASLRTVADTARVGIITTPDIGYTPESVGIYQWWAADNACFAHAGAFDLDKYLAWLERFDGIKSRCKFATAPDVVADWLATLARSLPVLPILRAKGWPAALVLQDGATPESIPWAEIDAVFVGGSTQWKTSHAAELCCKEARRRGKWVHMGRVNSLRRLEAARQMGCQSADGTFLAFGPRTNLPKLLGWLRSIEAQPCLWSAGGVAE
jgi:hypothetical protein